MRRPDALRREEGIFVGMSAGAAMKVALDEARALGKGTVVALLPDGGERYLSTSLFVSETVPEPLAFLQHAARQGGAAGAGVARQGHDLLLRAQPGRAARLGALPPGGLLRRASALSRMSRLSGQACHEPRRHRRPHRQGVPQGRRAICASSRHAGRRSSSKAWIRCASSERTTIPRPASTSATWSNRLASLLEKGLAYEKLRSVYFRISSFPDYGRLSGIEPERMRSEASTTYDYYEKDNPGDFALFKRPTLAELKAGIFWPTPWGNARPGWHVECACMAVRYLGQPIDIHTASTDLTFPHGDNEIAIACGLQDKPLAKLWMHCEVVMADGKKVSRAAGNDLDPGTPAGTGFRRADGPLLAAGHALSHGAPLFRPASFSGPRSACRG